MTNPVGAADMAQAVVDAFNSTPDDYMDPNGVTIQDVVLDSTPNGSPSVVLTVAGRDANDPVIIVNPPTRVPDPDGDITINGQRFREDPMAAMAWIVQNYGGQQ